MMGERHLDAPAHQRPHRVEPNEQAGDLGHPARLQRKRSPIRSARTENRHC